MMHDACRPGKWISWVIGGGQNDHMTVNERFKATQLSERHKKYQLPDDLTERPAQRIL
jgi:hypothetical protein